MISGRIDVVDSDGVGTKLLHKVGIELALCGVDERIVLNQLIRNAYSKSAVLYPSESCHSGYL